jgi:hypothetical protein
MAANLIDQSTRIQWLLLELHHDYGSSTIRNTGTRHLTAVNAVVCMVSFFASLLKIREMPLFPSSEQYTLDHIILEGLLLICIVSIMETALENSVWVISPEVRKIRPDLMIYLFIH